MIPARTPFFLPWLYPGLIWRMPATSKEIFLTFDDGPVPGPTNMVLDILSKFSVHATFFCIGDNVRKHPDVFRKVLDAGHAIGNHTYHHMNGWTTATSDYIQDTELCSAEIQKHGESVKLFRPPYGRISRRQIKSVEKDYKVVMWDVLTSDYNASLRPELCLSRAIGATREGSVVVFHDSFKAEKNVGFALMCDDYV